MTEYRPLKPVSSHPPSPQSPREENFRRRILTAVVIGAVTVILLVVAALSINVLLMLFLSILIAVVLRGFTNLLKARTRMHDQVAFALVLGGFVAFFVVGGLLLGPQLSSQLNQLVEQLPQSIERLRTDLSQTTWGAAIIKQAPQSIDPAQLLQGEGPQNVVSRATGIFSSALGFLANTIIILFLGIYFAVEPQTYIGSLLYLVPHERRPRVREILDEVTQILQRWLLARALSMLSVGVMSVIGLMLIGAPLALSLGLINGLLSFIPTFGPLIGAIPAALLALLDGPEKAILVLVVFIIVQQIDNYLVTPYIERKTAAIPPALTLGSQLFLSIFSGVIGLMVAAPLAAATVVFIREAYVEDVLGDEVSGEMSDVGQPVETVEG